MAREEKKDHPTSPEKPVVKYVVKESALMLPSGLITLNAENRTITLRPSSWNGIVAASQADLCFLYAMGHPFVEKE